MTTARVRKYVKDNAEKVEEWKNLLLKSYLINDLTGMNIEGQDITELHKRLTTYFLTSNQGQNKICQDVLYEHFELIHGVKREKTSYSYVDYLNVDRSAVYTMIDGIDVKPSLKTYKPDDVKEEDVYTPLKNMSVANIAYIYHHQDEYAFLIQKEQKSGYYRAKSLVELAVIAADVKDSADNIAFRNAVAAYYQGKMVLTGSVVCDLELPHLTKPTTDYNNLISHETSEFSNYILSSLISDVAKLTPERLSHMEDRIVHGIKYLTEMLEEYSQLKASILDADKNVDGGFQELFYQKTIAHLYHNIPLLINSDNTTLKNLAMRASKKKYT